MDYKAKCPEHDGINCMLAANYPYCDMTCPVNTYAKQAYQNNKNTDQRRNAKC